MGWYYQQGLMSAIPRLLGRADIESSPSEENDGRRSLTRTRLVMRLELKM